MWFENGDAKAKYKENVRINSLYLESYLTMVRSSGGYCLWGHAILYPICIPPAYLFSGVDLESEVLQSKDVFNSLTVLGKPCLHAHWSARAQSSLWSYQSSPQTRNLMSYWACFVRVYGLITLCDWPFKVCTTAAPPQHLFTDDVHDSQHLAQKETLTATAWVSQPSFSQLP